MQSPYTTFDYISSEPPLMLRNSPMFTSWCQRRDPQSGQNAPFDLLPLSVLHSQNFGPPAVNLKLELGMMNEIPNADADCARQFVQ